MAEVKRNIRDFGEYISGAKKELWASGCINPQDIKEMSESDRRRYLIKQVIFPKPNLKEMIQNDEISRKSAYYFDKVWSAVPETLPIEAYNDEERLRHYTETVLWIKSELETKIKGLSKETVYNDFRKKFLIPLYGRRVEIKNDAKDTVTNKLLRAVQLSERELDEKGRFFGMTADEKRNAEFDETFFIASLGGNYSLEEHPYYERYHGADKDKYRWRIKSSSGDYYYSPDDKNRIVMTEHIGENGSFFILDKSHHCLIAQGFKDQDSAASWLSKMKTAVFSLQDMEKKLKNQGKKRKTAFKPKNPGKITRENLPDYRNGEDVTGQMLLDEFGFRGGQFGNYLNDEDRQKSMNGFYDACKDEAAILGITDKSLSFGGKLAIAFGARGRGKALAHFEPVENVINLTKYKGAGSHGHEHGHALDYYLARVFKSKENFLSDDYLPIVEGLKEKLPAFEKIIRRMQRNENGELSDYYKESRKFDSMYAKSDHGYWHSKTEMFARAYDCYLLKKLRDRNAWSGYLTAHAESCSITLSDGTIIRAYPYGKDLEDLSLLFDELFDEMKREGILEAMEEK